MRSKIFIGLLMSLLVLVLVYPTISFGALYDNFQKKTIDPLKWGSYELVREIRDGKLVSKVTAYGSRIKNELNFKNPTSISYIEAEVTINYVKGNLGSTGSDNYSLPYAGITGFFYNDGSAAGPGSFKGEVQGLIYIGPFNNKLWVYWHVVKITNDAGTTWETLGWEWFPEPVSLNKPYKLSILFDSNSKTFTFKVGSTIRTWTSMDTISPSNIPWKVIRTDVRFIGTGTNLYGTVSATFDNVIAKDGSGNVIVNDDFSSPWINPDHWSNYEIVREVSGGKFWSELRSESQNLWNTLPFKNPEPINDFQAKVSVYEFQNPNGANTRARLGAYFYNDTGGSNSIGDVWAEVAIGGRRETPVAFWSVSRKNDQAGNSWTTLYSGVFPITVQLGEVYTLFLGWDGTKIIMKCNEFVESYTPTSSIYPPFDKTKALQTRISPPTTPSSYSTFISAAFDDVIVNELAQPVDGEWLVDISGTDKGGAVIKFTGYQFEGYGLTLDMGLFKITGNYDINLKGAISGNFTIYDYESGDILDTGNLTGKIDKNRTKLSFNIVNGPVAKGVRLPDDPEIPDEWTVKVSGGAKGVIDPFTIEPFEEDSQILRRVFLISGSGNIEGVGDINIEGLLFLTQKSIAYGFYEVSGDTYDKGTLSGKITLPSGKFNFSAVSEEGFRYTLTGNKKD